MATSSLRRYLERIGSAELDVHHTGGRSFGKIDCVLLDDDDRVGGIVLDVGDGDPEGLVIPWHAVQSIAPRDEASDKAFFVY